MNGLIPAGLQLGLQSLITQPWRGIVSQRAEGEVGYFKPMQADVVVEEVHEDQLEVTDHPVQNATSITDHAYKLPREVVVTYGWSDSPKGALPWYANVGIAAGDAVGLMNSGAAAVGAGLGVVSLLDIASGNSRVQGFYDQLMSLHEKRELVMLFTGRKWYPNMLLKGLSMTNDKTSAYSMTIEIRARQVILVSSATTTLKGDAAEIAKRGQQYLNTTGA